MRVLHVNDVASVGETLVAGLRGLGVDATLRRLSLPGGWAPTILKLAVLPLRLAELVRVDVEIRGRRVDLLHIHYAYLGMLGVVGRHRYVLHCHGSDVRDGLRDPLLRPLVLASLRGARAVLVSTPDLLDLARAVRADTSFLPSPIDLERFAPVERAPGGTRILLISDAHPLKGIDVAAGCARRLAGRDDIVVRAIARSAADQRRWRALGVTRFIPAVPHDRMPDLINAHDIVVGRFRLGSLGNNELESMACARPVVAEFRFPQAYTETPPVVGPEEIDQLVADVAYRESVGAAGRSWVDRHHGHRRVAERLLPIYTEALR